MNHTNHWDLSMMDEIVAHYSEAVEGSPVTYTYSFVSHSPLAVSCDCSKQALLYSQRIDIALSCVYLMTNWNLFEFELTYCHSFFFWFV